MGVGEGQRGTRGPRVEDMSLSVNYPSPVQVNGFTCHNCTEVGLAKKHIDPAHPRSGPYGADAASDPTLSPTDPRKVHAEEAKNAASGGLAASLPQGVAGSAPAGDPARGQNVNIVV